MSEYPTFGSVEELTQEGTMLLDPSHFAFPVACGEDIAQEGLNCRELFAAMALQGILAGNSGFGAPELTAARAVKMADALIAKLNQPVGRSESLPAVADADLD